MQKKLSLFTNLCKFNGVFALMLMMFCFEAHAINKKALIGDWNSIRLIDVRNSSAVVEHEATASKVSADQIFYLQSRGIVAEEAIKLIINGYCEEVFKQLPMEFALEANRLLDLKLEGSVG